MAVVSLVTAQGEGIGFTAQTGMRLVAPVEHAALFDLHEVSGGAVALRSIVPGWFVVADPDSGALAADAAEVEPRGTFLLESAGEGLAVLQLAGDQGGASPGKAADGGVALGATVRLVEQDMSDAPPPGCCCGPGVHGGANWEEATHRAIVEAAVGLLGAVKDDPVAQRFVTRFWDDEGFRLSLLEGLRIADIDYRYARPSVAGQNLYGGHFYDPYSRENFMDNFSNLFSGAITALTEGRRYFHLAAWEPRVGSWRYPAAGKALGLSLHFLTDLTQPMHASNFVNLCGTHYPVVGPAPEDFRHGYTPFDWRHANFELWVNQDAAGRLANLPPLTAADLDTAGIREPDELLHEAALASRRVFDEQLAAIADRKRGYEQDWSDAQPLLESTLRAAPRRVARYLKFWTEVSERPLPFDQKHWYRIKCSPPNRGGIALHGEADGSYFKRSDDTGGNAQFFFLRNQDASYAIACRDWIENLWYLYDGKLETWLGEDKGGGRRDEGRTRFLVVPNAAGDGVWFYETEREEVVTIYRRNPWADHMFRADPSRREDQLFHLEDAGEISADDHRRIKDRWTDWPG